MAIILQLLASFLAITTFLVVLNVPLRFLGPAGFLGMGVWLVYIGLRDVTNPVLATFIAASIGSACGQLLSIRYKAPAVVFILAVLAPLVPGYLSYRTTALFVIGHYREAIVQASLALMMALVISIGMAGGSLTHHLYLRFHRPKKDWDDNH